MHPELDELTTVSRAVGDDLELVQGPGGNTSVKTAEPAPRLLIKASGFRLADVGPHSAWVGLDLDHLQRIFADPELEALDPLAAHEQSSARLAQMTGTGPRASMETGFHLFLDRVVLHTHPVAINAFACAHGGRETLAELIREDLPWIDVAVPGFPLAAKISREVAGHKHPPRRLVLASHGLITAGPTPRLALESTRRLVDSARSAAGPPPGSADPAEPPPAVARWASQLQDLLAGNGRPLLARPVRRRAIQDAIRSADGGRTTGPLVPDDVVYGLHRHSSVDPGCSPRQWLAAGAEAPLETGWVELRGEGAVLLGTSDREMDFMEENLLANTWIHGLVRRLGQRPRLLEPTLIGEILGLGSEKYRQALAAGPPSTRENTSS